MKKYDKCPDNLYCHGCYQIIRKKLDEDVAGKLLVCIIIGLILVILEMLMALFLFFSAHFYEYIWVDIVSIYSNMLPYMYIKYFQKIKNMYKSRTLAGLLPCLSIGPKHVPLVQILGLGLISIRGTRWLWNVGFSDKIFTGKVDKKNVI